MSARSLRNTRRFSTRTFALGALTTALVVTACATTDQPGDAPLPTTPAEVTLVANPGAGPGRVAYVIALRDSSASLVVGSFRFAIHYDTTELRFTRLSGADSLLTAANDLGGKVLVAGASARGFGAGGWLALEFTRRDSSATESPTIEVLEIGGVMGGDLRQRIVARPAWTPR